MQGAWWYLVGDSPRGPVTMEVLECMLHHGEMTQQSLVWKDGLSAWIPVAELATLRETGALQGVPAPAIVPAPTLLAELPRAGAWRRFLARMLDLWIISVPTALLGGLLLTLTIPGFALWMERPSSEILMSLCLLPLVLLVEAGIFAAFGTTPGKALLGVVVVTLDGQRPSAVQYLRRQLGVFCFGFAFGLPLLSQIVMAAHGLSLQLGEPTPYDANRFMVRARPWSRGRVLVLAFIGCALLGLGLANAHPPY